MNPTDDTQAPTGGMTPAHGVLVIILGSMAALAAIGFLFRKPTA